MASDEGWHHITPAGGALYEQRYAWSGNYQGGRCTVRDFAGAYMHINPAGCPAYADHWRYAGDYRDGVAVVQAEHGRSTHIDADGQWIHGCWFRDLDVFHKGFARARDDDGWMHLRRCGTPAYARRFAAVEPFYNGQARVERFDGALEVIDESGATVVQLRPATRSDLAALSGDMVGFWRTQTIAAAVELGVIDTLPATGDEIAAVCGLRADGARRLLRALGELGLVLNDGAVWNLTPRGQLLRRAHSFTMADAALEYAGPFADMWTRLPDALRDGGRWSPPKVFEEVAEDALRREGHHRMLRSYARHDYPEVVSALGLRGDERIIDAAGGSGTLARLIAEAHPEARVVVLELAEVAELGGGERNDERKDPTGRAPTGVAFVAGDLFAPWENSADVVVLARVLHDWDDTRAAAILLRARASLVPGGRICIVEMVLREDGFAGGLCDLHLLMVTGGRERTVAEFEALLTAAGFRLDSVRHTPALPSVVVGVAV